MTLELVKSPFHIYINLLIMFKEVWCVKLGQEWVACGWGELSGIPYRGWKGKEGRENKDFKKGWQAGSRDGLP